MFFSLLNVASTCLFVCLLSMTRCDVVIVDILILLSSASTPLISFVSFPSTLLLQSVFTFFLLSIRQPFFLFSQMLLYSPLLVDRACFFHIPPYSCFLHRDFLFFFFHPATYPVIISSPFLFIFFYSDLLFFPGFLFFLHHPAYLLIVILSFSILF